VPAVRSPHVDTVHPSWWSNPTGEVTYGPHGEISLFSPSAGGSG
jgi:hypothetical protein